MSKFVKYVFSHAGLKIINMTNLPYNNDQLHMQHPDARDCAFKFYKVIIPDLILLAAIFLGLYTRWEHSKEDILIAVFAVVGLLVFIISGALYYYFSIESVECLTQLWFGCFLGFLALSKSTYGTEDHKEQIVNGLLLTSLVLSFTCGILLYFTKKRGAIEGETISLVMRGELFEVAGLLVSCSVAGPNFLTLSILVLALMVTVVAIKLKSLLAILHLVFMVVSVQLNLLPGSTHLKMNPYAAACIVGRLAGGALISCIFSNLTTLERWYTIFHWPHPLRRLLILLVTGVELTFFVTCAMLIPNHKEWYIVVPFFIAFSILWILLHVSFLVTSWSLMTKITECNSIHQRLSEEQHHKHSSVMAAKGLRYFSVVTSKLVLFTLVSTIILAGICWTTHNELNHMLLLLVLPIEIAVFSLLFEMSSALGGTSIGYAVIVPVTNLSGDGASGPAVTVLPQGFVDEVSIRCTRILQAVQRFFAYHLITNYGCDYSYSGMQLVTVMQKLRQMFTRCTPEGPRFDTYCVYYSGPAYADGDWALADNERLSFDALLQCWEECNQGSRLLLILDTRHSHQWLRHVRTLRSPSHLALQTVKLCSLAADPERVPMHVGDFTSLWVLHNCEVEWQNWGSRELGLRAHYSVSPRWTESALRNAQPDDIEAYWRSNFPLVTHWLVSAMLRVQCPTTGAGAMSSCCTNTWRLLRRLRHYCFPVKELSVGGHGFKLIQS